MVVAKGWWTAAQALAWIALGEPDPPAPWPEMPGKFWSCNWVFNPPDDLLPALRARAARQSWRPTHPLVRPASRYRAIARRLAREMEEDAAVLVRRLEADLARMAAMEAAVAEAQAELVSAVADGRLTAQGVRLDFHGHPVGDGVPKPIEASVFRGANRTITLHGTVELPPNKDGHTVLHDIFDRGRPRWGEITFAAADVKRLWPLAGRAKAPRQAELRAWMLRFLAEFTHQSVS